MTGRKRWVIKKGVKTTGDEVERRIKKETKDDNMRKEEKKTEKRGEERLKAHNRERRNKKSTGVRRQVAKKEDKNKR